MAKGKLAVPVSDDDWQVRDDFRTVCEARKIEKDPKRFAKVQAHAKQLMLQAGSIASEDAEAE